VGPPPIKSPIVGMSFVLAIASATPAAPNLARLGVLFNIPKFFALSKALAPFKATPPGTPS